MYNHNKEGKVISFQVSVIRDIPKGKFTLENGYFLVKNLSTEPVEVSCIPAGQDDAIITVLFPGWNPELFKSITVNSEKLQYGY